MESESMTVILVTLLIFMLGFSVARMSSDKMTIKQCLASTATVIEKAQGIGVGDE